MDIREFKDIGIVDIYWTYYEFDCKWERAFISLYIPKVKGYEYGKQYCLKISFLEGDNIIDSETFENTYYDLQVIEEQGDIYLIKILGLKLKVNKKQYNLLKKFL